MTQKIIQIGNSTGIIIPKEIMTYLGLKPGSQVVLERDEQNASITISKDKKKKTTSSITPRFLKILDRVNQQYGQALKELAQK